MSIRAVEWALNVSVGNIQAKVVLICLADNADNEKFQCWPSARSIAIRSEISERSVYRAVKYLDKHNFLTCEHRRFKGGVNRAPLYTLNIPTKSTNCLIDTPSDTALSVGSATAGSRGTVKEPSLSLGRVFVELGTEAWKAWERDYELNKRTILGRPPRTFVNGTCGWYFPSEYPQ